MEQSKYQIILRKVSFSTSIEELRDMGLFSVRAYNVCQINNCLTVSSLIELSKTDIIGWKGCGNKIIHELFDFIGAIQYLKKLKKISLSTSIEELRDMGLFSVRTYNGCQTNGCWTVSTILKLTKTDIMGWKGCGNKVVYELNNFKEAVKNSNLLLYSKNECSNYPSKSCSQSLFKLLIDIYCLSIINGILDYRNSTKSAFDNIKVRSIYKTILSLKGDNEIKPERFDDIIDKLELLLRSKVDLIPNERNDDICGLVKEVSDVIEQIRQEIFNVSFEAKTITLLKGMDSDITLKLRFPFLTHEELSFCKHFLQNHSVLPKLFILYKNLIRSSDRQAQMLCLRYGMYSDGIEKGIDAIATQFDITPQRVRQLTDPDGIAIKNVSPKELIDEADYLDITFLSEDDEFVTNILKEQNLLISPRQLLSLIDILNKRLGSKCFSKGGRYHLFDWELYNKVDLERLKNFVKYQVPHKRMMNVEISLDACIMHVCKDIKDFERTAVKALIQAFMKDFYNIYPEGNESFYWEQTHVSFQDVLEIVAEKDRIVTMDEIIKECAEQFPGLKCSRDAILQNPLITSVGLKGYVPTSQRFRYFVSIGDCVVAILEKYNEPLSLSDLLSQIEDKGYVTSASSLRNILCRKEENRFIRFTGNLWGLTSKNYGDLGHKKVTIVKRKSFETRLLELKEFIDLNKRMPNHSHNETEASMCRWLNNIEKGIIPISEEQKSILEKILEESVQLPQNQYETRFFNNCKKYREVVEFLGQSPSPKSRPQLCAWFYSTQRKENLSANSRKAFDELLQWLESKGIYYT